MTALPNVRDVEFDLDGVPRHWNGGRKSVTSFFDALSVFFPVGERFFITSVRAHDRYVTDDSLREAVRAFCNQEGIHGREHTRYNEMLEAQGYPAEALERDVTKLLQRVKKRSPKRVQLAITCALEHYTAIMAHLLLENPEALGHAHPKMAELWRWHAVEESEHKSVPYDVYIAAGAPYYERVSTMVIASLVFWGKVLQHQVKMMRTDGTLFSLREWGQLLRFWFIEPGLFPRMAPLWVKYFRPGFHPNDIDSSHLLQAWLRTQRITDERAAHAPA
ncbi:hypothetical protein AKJ09_01161 [Labilithrix luteola]|uniref:Metal-dependent hydrolase n=1 Tax=Labilithrix luteola TaxID=1391654 RepID=A0A0K1PLU9_9BACT|nr:metal-dependent hydrolase [Labilithrix luteola]AKU94497.1 hypothetical protein AKJ09_01161 [Labilithrix luteola]